MTMKRRQKSLEDEEKEKTLSVSRSDDDGISTHFVVQNRAKRVFDDSSLRSLS